MHYGTLAIRYAVDDKTKPVKVTQRKAAARLVGIIGLMWVNSLIFGRSTRFGGLTARDCR